jgi:hypothetical protein
VNPWDRQAGIAAVPSRYSSGVGLSRGIQPGEFIQASGLWDNRRDHGIQFKTAFLKAIHSAEPPADLVLTSVCT